MTTGMCLPLMLSAMNLSSQQTHVITLWSKQSGSSTEIRLKTLLRDYEYNQQSEEENTILWHINIS
jgi:hypothetical protein